jgi:hypothetical protein
MAEPLDVTGFDPTGPGTFELSWTGGSGGPVDLDHSTDGGVSWNPLATGVTSPQAVSASAASEMFSVKEP